ncbi:non-receptor serine/threonine protein kinase [Lithospermum erythrorhizon]|uniref:Non-receptor serine/threonine protein kinase n=1 Tax=Lithospermum erythrorhizon TaxID=34254 RepID=A0AAV3NPI4_LITER
MEISSPSTAEAIASSTSEQSLALPSKKRRNLPGMPDPDAEVIALSPKSLLATNKFVCEICNKGFQRDQNLQLHRRGHNLPWKLKQRTSKEIRKRVYVCPETSCVHHDPSRALGDLTGIKKHFCRKHGEKKFKCERCSKKYAVLSDWKAHMKTCGTREYRCDCGTLFSRRDSFITHRAFCDALAQESAKSQVVAESNSDEGVKVEEIRKSSSPPPPLTPSTGVVSPVFSIQSSDLPENQSGHLHQQPGSTAMYTSTAPVTAASVSTSSISACNVNHGNTVFASVFAPSSSPAISQATQPSSSYSGVSFSIAGSDIAPALDPVTLSLASSMYLSGNVSSLFPTSQDHYLQYSSSPRPPALSATALLQKAAQMGSSSSSGGSFLRGLGLTISSSSDHQENRSSTIRTSNDSPPSQWNSNVKLEGNQAGSSGLGLGIQTNGSLGMNDYMMGSSTMFHDKPTTLDLLGLGISPPGASPAGYSSFVNSMGGEFGNYGASSIHGVSSSGSTWADPPDRKPTMQ